MLAVFRGELQFRIFGFGDEISVLHGRIEGLAQRFEPLRREVWRRDERAADALPGIEEFDRLALLGGAREIEHEWNAAKLGIGRGAALKENRNRLRRDPVRSPHADAVEALADALDLAALHRKKNVGGCRKPADDLEFRSDQRIERLRISACAGAGTGIAEDELLVE